MKRMLKQIAIRYLLLSVTMQFLLSGCVTNLMNEKISSMPHYEPEQYPLRVKGTFRGTFTYKNIEYMHFYFPHFPWPARYGNGMHFFLPNHQEKVPVVMNKPEDLYASDYRGKEIISVDYIYGYSKFVSLGLPNPLKTIDTKVPAELFISTQASDLPKKPDTKGISFYVFLMATKQGPESQIRVAKVTSQDTLSWGPSYILDDTPYQGQWYSPWYNLSYLYTVPIDIVTFPLQIPYYITGNVIGRGMSPR